MKKEIKWVELGEIVEETYTGALITKSQIVTEGIPCIRYGEIYTIYDIWCGEVISRAKLDPSKKYRYCKKGDLLITKIGETVTDIAKPLAYLGEEFVAIDSNTTLLRHNQNAKYLAYALSTSNIKKQKQQVCNFAPITVSINLKQIFKLRVPLPSLEKQEKIAKWLDAFSSLERQLERQLERHKSRYKYYLNRLMRGGQMVKLGNVCDIQVGLPALEKEIFKENIDISLKPLVKIGNFENSGINTKNLNWIDPNNFQNTHKFIAKKGEILMAKDGCTVGKIALNDSLEEIYFSSTICKLIPKTLIQQRYFFYALQAKQQQINKCRTQRPNPPFRDVLF